MKEEILFRCGHHVQVELPNAEKARASMRGHMQERRCRDCDYRERVLQAQQHAVQLGLVSLRGTPKQVAYACLLRGQQISFFLRKLDLAKRADPYDSRWEQMCQQLFSTINNLADASWWIEHQELKHLLSILGKTWEEENYE